jgi:hypothetical protein
MHNGTKFGETQPPLQPANLEKGEVIDLFLLAGQSNMKGRAKIDLTPHINPDILFFHSKKEKWFTAREPIHAQGVPDLIDNNDNAGTGPGVYFAKELIKKNKNKIGLIPAAVGGAPIDSFGAEGEFYKKSINLIKQCKIEYQLNVNIKAILWLQGESDSTEERYMFYEKKLLNLVDRYRNDLNNATLPFIACTIGSFINKGKFLYCKEINDILLDLPNKRTATSCIDARDLDGHIGDALHYNEESQLQIGKRFAQCYLDDDHQV